jgi:DNA modification methylase
MNQIIFGDCRETMRQLAADNVKVQMCVTSPPYYGLRDYGHDGQIGLEETPEQYIEAMVEVFRCVKDILANDGVLWLNIGDSYCGTGDKGNYQDPKYANGRNGQSVSKTKKLHGYKSKDLIGIPWMLAFALRADGWYLRQDIIWHKPNPMPESVQDRCTKAHEYIFLLSKSPKYFYDNEAIKVPVKEDWGTRDRTNGKYHNDGTGLQPHSGLEKSYDMANKRSVWSVNTKPYTGAHFAVFPEELIEPCILAGTSQRGHCPKCNARWSRQIEHTNMVLNKTDRNNNRGTRTGTSGTMVSAAKNITTGWIPSCNCGVDSVPDIVFDPFMGSGTTAQVAQKLGRKYLGCELNEDYKTLQDKRLAQQSLELV